MTAAIAPVAVTACTATCAAGRGVEALAAALTANVSALAPNDFGHPPPAGWTGRVAGLEDLPWPPERSTWDSRATRLVALGLQADGFDAAVARARRRHGATRVGLVLGTSAATIGASEEAYRRLDEAGRFLPELAHAHLNTPHAPAAFAQRLLALEGPALTVSTACSSSAKAFACGERWLRLGLVDAVVVGGVDALCDSLLYGFRALGLVGTEPCRPFDAARAGISIGEASAWALLEREGDGPVLAGWGESNDAHHMSSPHPQGLGAELALDAALARAGLEAAAVDHVSLHGTASAQNDEVEAALVARRYAPGVHASATKGLTGHTMGAAGALQAVACLLALQRGLAAGSPGTQAVDPAFGPVFAGQLQLQPRQRRLRWATSHSFGFGGNNCVLVFGAAGG
ncbi:MAG: beta-ketoacyl-ACP synthase [Rubrivivax sp.]